MGILLTLGILEHSPLLVTSTTRRGHITTASLITMRVNILSDFFKKKMCA